MTDDKYPEYYEKIYIPQQIERMIEYADMASAVTDRVPLIEKAWKIVIKSGLYKIKDKEKGKIENKKGIDSLNKGNTEEALKHFKKAAEFSPGDPEFVNNTGYAYELLEAYETAMEWYFKTLASDPSRAVAWYNLGCCKAIKGKKEEATGCFYNYIRFAPHEGEAKKAIKELSLKDKSKAVREAAKAAYEGYNSEM